MCRPIALSCLLLACVTSCEEKSLARRSWDCQSAIDNNNWGQMRELLGENPGTANGSVYPAGPLLHYAVGQNKTDAVRILLDHGADIDATNMHDPNSRTALQEAVMTQKLEMVRILVDRGAALNSRDKSGDTALHLVFYGHNDSIDRRTRAEIARLLIEKGADIDARDGDGATALRLADHCDCQETVSLLIARGAKDTPAHFLRKLVLPPEGSGTWIVPDMGIPYAPYASSDRDFVHRLCRRMFGDTVDSARMTAGLIAGYRHQLTSARGFQTMEIAVAVFENPSLAAEAFAMVSDETLKRSGRVVALQRGSHVVRLWRDTEGPNADWDAAITHMNAHTPSR